ncbi:MAG: 23S rRNA (guanosine(2251)-2'-O)-methyltransferase RlmB [Clostridiaceae bacterium]|nr:23S rRNA (guanosine(2251)-2'-O)-methyltransferase RlmB [Clostridia bacterium]MDY3869670.1 23S rRNA (guanosine(2251)-2'-O)-methyltransferase RlmB [Clostridiaceae bacterium]
MEKPRYTNKKTGGRDRRPYPKARSGRTGSAFAAMEQMESRETAGDAGLIEGRNAVWEALQSGRQLDKILIAQGAQNLGHILAAARAAGVAIQECDRRKLDKLSVTGAHQGIMAQGAAAEYKTIDDILALAAARGEKPLLVLCDGLTDPHNLGAVIRSCEVLGGHGVVVPRHRSAGLNAACAKAAAGALEHLPVAKCANMSTAISELKEKGVFILAADMGGQAAASIDFDMPCAIVIGAEGSGVSEGVRKAADLTVSIPQKGAIQSLNASNAAAILLYEAVRQRG